MLLGIAYPVAAIFAWKSSSEKPRLEFVLLEFWNHVPKPATSKRRPLIHCCPIRHTGKRPIWEPLCFGGSVTFSSTASDLAHLTLSSPRTNLFGVARVLSLNSLVSFRLAEEPLTVMDKARAILVIAFAKPGYL